MKRWAIILTSALLFGAGTGLRAQNVGLIKVTGAIGPATATYISRAIQVADSRHDACLIIELDTPGGLVNSTEQIVQSFYKSRVPTVVYVSPEGAGAGSAGVFITLAADIAAMAPNTTIGAAHPVSIGPTGGGEAKGDDVMKEKLENFYTSYIETIANKRKRNVEWAKSAVRESKAITAEQALELNVIEIIAKDTADLLGQIDGREINGKALKTSGAKIVEIPRAAREKVFQLLWRPEVMLILMLMAMYGIIGELSNPGAILPGVVGGIALILFLYMATILPINVAGLALIGLAIGLFIADIYAPSHGVLTVGGIVAFFLGALMVFNRTGPLFKVSLWYIVLATAVTAVFFIFVVAAGLRAQSLPVRAGRETMLGQVVPALERIDAQQGKVFVEGEYWNAVSAVPIEAGRPVEIIGMDGLTLKVKPKDQPATQ